MKPKLTERSDVSLLDEFTPPSRILRDKRRG